MDLYDLARLPDEERGVLFREGFAQGLGNPLIVEKDFWVSFLLSMLFSSPFGDRLVFKGGTTLSKVYGITWRFSEDIDLSLDSCTWGFIEEPCWAEHALSGELSRSRTAKDWNRIQTRCAATVKDRIMPVLKERVAETLGSTSTKAGFRYVFDPRTKSPTIFFDYPSGSEGDAGGYIAKSIKLEFGSLIGQEPVVESAVFPSLAVLFDETEGQNMSCRVRALGLERTFWEKATILHSEYHRPLERAMRERSARDYYDVYMILNSENGEEVLRSREILEKVISFKRCFFRSSWSSFDLALSGELRLAPKLNRLAELRADYRKMQPMFLKEPPRFADIVDFLGQAERTFNSADH